MPQITVKISQNSSEISNKSFKCESDKFPDLLKSLAKAKEDTNAALTKLIETSKTSKTSTTHQKDDLEDEESSDDEENEVENSNKKIKT